MVESVFRVHVRRKDVVEIDNVGLHILLIDVVNSI